MVPAPARRYVYRSVLPRAALHPMDELDVLDVPDGLDILDRE
jgi:hypothetical protein